MVVITNKDKYNAKYGFSKGTPHSKNDISKTTGIPVRFLNKVYDRGSAARRNNPQSVRRASDGRKIGGSSLKGKMSSAQWSMGRIYSFVTKQAGTWKTADKDIADDVKKLKIKGFTR